MSDGMLLLDKPAGITSNGLLQRVRRWAGTRRVGHTGTLDPLATGLLVALVGRATRLAPFLPAEPKEYLARLRFGVTTDTDDAEGQVHSQRPCGDAPPDAWEAVLAAHRGDVELAVPRFAAVKVRGRALYRYARAGVPVALPKRTMTIHALAADASQWPGVDLKVRCGSGTYIRSLARSLGEACGTGAHLVSLRRTQIGPWSLSDAVTPDLLVESRIPERGFIPIDRILPLRALALEPEQEQRVLLGRAPEALAETGDSGLEAGERFVFTAQDGRLLAVARASAAWEPGPRPPAFRFERVVGEP